MKTANCSICYKVLSLYRTNNQIYCGDACYAIAKKAKDRITSQNRVFENIKTGRVCKRCKKTVHEKGMKKYCTQCRDTMETKVVKKKVVKKVKTKRELCIRCKKKPKWSTNDKTKYCADCKKEVAKEQSRAKQKNFTAKRAKETEVLKKTEKNPIDPKWTQNRGSGKRNAK